MQQFKLANVLLESTKQFFAAPMLYCRAEGAMLEVPGEPGTWELRGPGAYDFTTFFNGLSVMKWQRYTVAREFFLHLEVSGAACSYVQTRADSFSWQPDELDDTRIDVPASDSWLDFDVPIAVGAGDVLCGFILRAEGPVRIRRSYYYTQLSPEQIRPVELALCTTTFKKEEFIVANIALVKEHVLGAGEAVSDHFTMHVVDNGRTLPAASLEAPRVHVHANPNAGGAGGFARGMIEAGRQEPRATHVLLMDDDVELSAESVIRTYNLMSIVDDDHADALLSGAMMNMSEPSFRWEDVGFMTYSGIFAPLKPASHMNELNAVACSEVFQPHPDVPRWEDQGQAYAAWWYCCIPMTVVDRQGLPLPFFVRCDDVEYSLRGGSRIMSMCGICIWHMSFHLRYSAAVERYQTTRNTFIAQAASGVAPLSDFAQELHRNVQLELKKFNYTNAELALEGFEDFLAGPDHFMRPGFAEESFMGANRRAEQYLPWDELAAVVRRDYGIDLDALTSIDVTLSMPRGRADAAVDFLTFNGQRFDGGYFQKGSVAVIDAKGWVYQPGTMRRCETLVALDIPNRRGAVRHVDPDRFREVWGRYKRDMRQYKERRADLEAAWREAAPKMRSLEYWCDYLGIG